MGVYVTHLHLLLNHFPTIGFIVGLALFFVALAVKSDELEQAALVVFVGVALLTVPTYASGNAAEVEIEDLEGISETLIHIHEGAAFLALVLIELTGAVAWLALWHRRRGRTLSTGSTTAIAALSLVAFGVVAEAANIGGQIRHTEIQGASEPTFVGPIGRTVGGFVANTPWAWVSSETLHFVGLSLLIGVVGLLALRMTGVVRNVSAASVDRLLPWGMLGFALNTMTGMLFFAAQPEQYIDSYAFFYKLFCVLGAGACMLYFTVDRSWLVESGEPAPALAKTVAASAFVLWVVVLFWGSMLPFIGTAF